jgi:glycolate oxidase FAD binding subunit
MTTLDTGLEVVERPTSVAEAAELLKSTSGPVAFRGAGTKWAWGGRPQSGVVVDTTGLAGLLAHNPADMTVAVEAGMPLRTLQELLAKEGQWLAIDPPSEADGATVAGLLSTGDSGPRRLRYGGMRDLVIGVTMVLADGTVARAGGKVIKNVAGFDLSKMLYGSLGTLGLIAEVVLRLHPLPGTSATAALQCSAQQASELSVALMSSALEPAAIDWVLTGDTPDPNAQSGSAANGSSSDRPGQGRLVVRFEGTAAGVAAQRAAVQPMLDTVGDSKWFTDGDESGLWNELAGYQRPAGDSLLASAATLPTHTADVATALAQAAQAAGVTGQLTSRPALGLHTARLTGPGSAVATAFEAWRSSVLDAGTGASVLLRDRPDGVDDVIDPMGPPPSSVQLMRALKQRLDPDGRCAPGRLGSWY